VKIEFTLDSINYKAILPSQNSKYVEIEELTCECNLQKLQVLGDETKQIIHFNYINAPAHCNNCGVYKGQLKVTIDTLFGLEEDNAVLNGRARVY